MKPLNRAERNSAFLSFLLLFFVTIGLIVTIIFFSIEVPLRDNEKLRKAVSELEREKQLSDSFAVAMKAAMYELDKFDLKNEDASAYSVKAKINNMRKFISENIPNSDSSLYTLVIKNLDSLNEAKTRIGSMGN